MMRIDKPTIYHKVLNFFKIFFTDIYQSEELRAVVVFIVIIAFVITCVVNDFQ